MGFSLYSWNKLVRHLEHARKRFVHKSWSQGVVLIICLVIAMLLANLPATKHVYHSILETSFTLNIGYPGSDGFAFPAGMTVEKFINDVLMAVFFFCVGLEIKREVACGELCTVKKALMPVIAAAGGVAVPAIIFTIINHGTAASSGWGIPTATDIAFALCVLTMLGKKVPVSLKIFLTALAIVDDLIAILVVALFYGGTIHLSYLLIAFSVVLVVALLNRIGEKRLGFYLVPGIIVWILFYYSGVHATMAGVVMAFLIPMQARYSRSYIEWKRKKYRRRIKDADGAEDGAPFPNGPQRHCQRRLTIINRGGIGLSYRLEYSLLPWVNFCIMPIFALANAGVEIPDLSYFNVFRFSPELGSVSMGVFLGLLLGKPIGITLASFLAVKTGVGQMPEGASWKTLFAVACVGGIGFTMSIFIDTLSFSECSPETIQRLRDMGKIAVLLGSVCSALLGSALITLVHNMRVKKILR